MVSLHYPKITISTYIRVHRYNTRYYSRDVIFVSFRHDTYQSIISLSRYRDREPIVCVSQTRVMIICLCAGNNKYSQVSLKVSMIQITAVPFLHLKLLTNSSQRHKMHTICGTSIHSPRPPRSFDFSCSQFHHIKPSQAKAEATKPKEVNGLPTIHSNSQLQEIQTK